MLASSITTLPSDLLKSTEPIFTGNVAISTSPFNSLGAITSGAVSISKVTLYERLPFFASSKSLTIPILVGPFNPPSFIVPRLLSFSELCATVVCSLPLSPDETLSFTFVFPQAVNANNAHAIIANILFFITTSKIYLF